MEEESIEKMVEIVDKDGVVALEGAEFNLKIDKNRKIYVKAKDKNTYTYIGHDSPLGMSSEEKKKLLYELYRNISVKLKQQ